MRPPLYVSTPATVARGAVLAALAAATLTTIPFLAAGPLTLVAFVVALMAWGAGIAVLGVPVWMVLHRLRLRSPAVAIAAGMLIPAATLFFSGAGIFLALLLGAVGGAAGLTAQLTAYRPAPRVDVTCFSDGPVLR